MRKQLSFRDMQALSEYLDGKLSPIEKSRLESRLLKEADLRDALEGLRRTKIILHNSPKIRAPHNFTLSRQMAGVQEKQGLRLVYPLLKLSTVLASILFVIAVLGDILVKQPLPMSPLQAKEMAPAAEYGEELAAEAVEEYGGEQEMAVAYPTMTIAPVNALPTEAAVEKSFELSNAPMEPLPSTIPSVLTMESTSAAHEEAPMIAAEPQEADTQTREGVTASGVDEAMEAEAENGISDTGVIADQAMESEDIVAQSPTEEMTLGYGEQSEAPKYSIEKPQEEMDIWRILEIIFGILIIISGLSMLIYRAKNKI